VLNSIRTLSLLVAAATLTAGGCAPARMAAGDGALRLPETGRGELAPLAFVRFCMDYADQCRADAPGETIALTASARETLAGVNASVNQRIRSNPAAARWRIDPAAGNCNDYVVTKRHDLIARGFPASALLMSVVRTPSGEGHLVLIARTDHGDLVLDNLNPEIVARERTAYRWLKRQSAADARFWEAM
jgi:predicted transglutaminase-like cysteine proteinase